MRECVRVKLVNSNPKIEKCDNYLGTEGVKNFKG